MKNPVRTVRDHGEDGLSLIEMMVAVFILAVSILALAGIATQSIARVRVARDQQTAADLVSALMESARGIDFDSLALDSSDPSIPPLFEGDPVAAEVGGPLVHRETVSQGNRTYDVVRYVTVPSTPPGQDPLKRVIITVEWADSGRDRELTNETVVAAADRGLPVPQFDLSPPNAVISFVAGEGKVDDGDGPTYDVAEAECETHTLNNLGLTDRYGARLQNRNDSSSLSITAGGSVFTDASRKWAAKMFFQLGTESLVFDSTTEMRDSTPESSGPIWVESPTPVPSKASASLTVCYWATESTGANAANEWQYRLNVRSDFDESVIETSVHTVTAGPAVLTLHLHELTNNHGGNWSGGAHRRRVGGNDYPPMPMDRVQPTNIHSHDMDSTIDGTSTPGLRVRRDDLGASAAVWDWTVDETRSLGSGTLNLRVAAPGTGTATVTYALQRVSTDGSTVLATLSSGSTDVVASGGTAGDAVFQPVSLPLTFESGESVATSQVLRLVVGCAPASTVDCHVDFDNTTNRGILELQR